MISNIKKGQLGEVLASTFLQKKGFTIRCRNYRYRHAEIDIIAIKEDLLIFVEVKLRTSLKFGYPEASVDNPKVEKILEATDEYLYKAAWTGKVRFDVISIVKIGSSYEIKHFEDAFH